MVCSPNDQRTTGQPKDISKKAILTQASEQNLECMYILMYVNYQLILIYIMDRYTKWP